MTELVARLPRVRRRKPLPPGFKVALAQVLYCHFWIVGEIFRFVTHRGHSGWVLFSMCLWTTLAWAKPTMRRHVWYDVFGCVHYLYEYWKQWKADE